MIVAGIVVMAVALIFMSLLTASFFQESGVNLSGRELLGGVALFVVFAITIVVTFAIFG